MAGQRELDDADVEVARAFEQAVDSDGVDRSLIRWMLRLSPTERLTCLESTDRMLASVKRLPNGPG